MTLIISRICRPAVLTAALAALLCGCPEGGDSFTSDAAQAENPPPSGPNTAPTISGSPTTAAAVGSAYAFAPTANDADDDPLIFSVDAKPEWAAFDSATGQLSGTPQAGDEGSYAGVVISVTDGAAGDSLKPFTIVVAAQGGGSGGGSGGSGDGDGDGSDGDGSGGDGDDGDGSGGGGTAAYVGFGAATKGATSCPTGLSTYEVTSLSGGSGSGTLRDAVSQDCRDIVFTVGGNIPIGDLQISKSYLTIDGATAPAPGITLTNVGRLVLEARGDVAVHDVIINNIRAIGEGGSVETNDLWELDGSSGAPIYNVVLDHLTMIASGDGNVDIFGDVHDITLSNSLILDSVQGHHFSQSGGLRERLTIYGNVYARLNERQPRIRYNTRQLDFVGNVVYGWGWFEGGAAGMHIDAGSGTPSANVEQNVYLHVSGLSGSPDDALKIEGGLAGSWFFDGNTWPAGETDGDSSGNSSRISTVHNGVDYRAPRQVADVRHAGTHFPSGSESQLLAQIADAAQQGSGSGSEPPPEELPPEEPPPEEPPPEEPPPQEPPPQEPPPEVPPPSGGGDPGPSAYRGIPEPSDVLGFDVWASYTTDQQVTGNRGDDTLSCNGTEANPCVIDASGATFSHLTLTGTYLILQGGRVNSPAGDDSAFSAHGCNFCVIRDLEVSGAKSDEGHSTAAGLGLYNVWIRGSIHGFGDNRQSAPEQDYHGIKVLGSDVWILDAEIYDVSGDSVQVGDASRGAAERVYIGGGYFHHNRENAVDIKDSQDVVVSGVMMEGFRPTSSSPGEALIIHDDAYDARVYDNVVRDATLGMVSSGAAGHIIDGNNIQALSVGIQLRNTHDLTVTNNTISAPTRIQVQSGVSGNIQN